MKAVVYFCLFSILLCCGIILRAEKQPGHYDSAPVSHHAKRPHVKINNSNQFDSLLAETEIETTDEYHNGNDEEERLNQFLSTKNALANTWYLTFSIAPISNRYCKHYNSLPLFCGNSSPIYITQRVLRI